MPRLLMHPIKSSFIKRVGYVEGYLVIEMSERTYVYVDVPFDVYFDLLIADSVGAEYNRLVKGQYEVHKLGGREEDDKQNNE